ncbi:helix-turn-helix domain-containing protein [Paenibacillus sp. HJL G12]|uniref:Helix-turn-helix domain-containing protein n=1 Tax=Paenibacillus dendrobii TaxID=2691084 RepID=A0A7X3LGI1_9BACL|nr:helix-turn-helix domain-containing protein [Paenibacillus dendrobii]MWV44781.1 helix-turn-helix domain-containing protein [Paenibacillus dendrobii]
MGKYKAFIVDDEPLARLALREYITLTSSEIEIIGEAGDGEEALKQLEERQDVDIVLADIQMPRMNGVQLLEALGGATFSKQPLTIMLSAFGDYDYVRESFVLGAFDYMLKANLEESYIAPVLQKTVEELDKRQSQSADAADHDEDTWICSILHRLAVEWMPFPCSEDDESFNESLLRLKKHMGEKNQVAAVIRLSEAVQLDQIHRMILQTVQSVAGKDRQEAVSHVCRADERQYNVFFTFPGLSSSMAVRRLSNAMLTDIKIRLKQFLNLNLSIGISDAADGLQEWNRLFRQAERLSVLSYYQGYDRLFYPESEKKAIVSEEEWKDGWPQSKAELVQALKDPDGSAWKRHYESCCELLTGRFPSQPGQIRSELGDLIWTAGSLLYRKGRSSEELHEAFPHPLEQVRLMGTWEETVQWCDKYLDFLHESLHPKTERAGIWLSPIVAKTKAILEKHYCEEIHLSVISQMVGVSESYLSKQFSKEVGINFIQYLTQLRIEKAKKGLENGLKIYEVAEMVGYVNPEHFSRLFKKVTGVSPLAYRRDSE